MEFKLDQARIIVSEIEDGSMDRANIDENLPRFLKKYNLGDVAYCEQVHGKDIRIIDKKGFYASCDGLVTGEDIGLIIKSADCVPLLFVGKKGIIGAIHVGRRSLLSGVIKTSLKDVFEKFCLSPSEVKFFLAPHIRLNNYEIQTDLKEEISKAGYSPFIFENHFDLSGALVNDLVKLGAKEENIHDSGVDNHSSENLFSYRRGDRNKLFINVIKKNNQ